MLAAIMTTQASVSVCVFVTCGSKESFEWNTFHKAHLQPEWKVQSSPELRKGMAPLYACVHMWKMASLCERAEAGCEFKLDTKRNQRSDNHRSLPCLILGKTRHLVSKCFSERGSIYLFLSLTQGLCGLFKSQSTMLLFIGRTFRGH